jgi:hypothetical protein
MSGIIAQNTLDGSGLIKSPEGGGAWNFIKKLTASDSADLSFVNGTSDVVLDSTYKEYIFYFVNIHPETDSVAFEFNGSADTGSNYNVTKTTSRFDAYHDESGSGTSLGYQGGYDLAESTAFQNICDALGNDNDQSLSGYMHLFSPSDTTFVKHFMIRVFRTHAGEYASDLNTAGYFNTTSAVDAIQFKMSSDAIGAGDIILHGLTT